ncbi:MAG: diguanylate cyclase, partial [Nitrospirae bacterium]|nr:diguanylate cyclase [Nitrospirota bacterium]
MNSVVEYNIKDIDRREKHLWLLAFALIFVLSVVTVGTYFFLVDEAFQDFGVMRTMANRALGGLGVLIVLFCAYVVHTRTTFGRMRDLLERKANRDDLTDLYNRRYFEIRLEEEIARANQNKDTFVILLCDIDGFKAINDSWGHQAGDEALKTVAQCLKESTRGTDFVARWGGDEMVAFISNTGREGGLITAERIRKSVRKKREKADLDLDLSIGVTLFPEHGKNAHELLRLSDKALYIAKKGGDKIHVGEEEYRVDENSVKIVFQPVVDIRTNRTLGYEALGRDPQGKVSILDLFKRYQVVGQLTELKCLCFTMEIEKAQKAGIEKLFANVDMNMLRNLEPIS